MTFTRLFSPKSEQAKLSKLPSRSEVYARQQTQEPGPGGRITTFNELNLILERGSPLEGRVEEASRVIIQAMHKAFPDGEVPSQRHLDGELIMAKISST